MHPGNIFVNIDNPRLPFYCGIDFGIMGRLSEDDCYYLGENFLAFFNRDYARVAVLHKEAGWVAAEVDLIALTAAITKIAEPLFQKPLNEISFGQVLLGLLKVAREFSMHIQPQLLLLQKTLLNVEGLGRQLYPQLDLWETAKPHLEKILRGKISWSTRWNLLKQQCSKFSWDLEKLPETIEAVLNLLG